MKNNAGNNLQRSMNPAAGAQPSGEAAAARLTEARRRLDRIDSGMLELFQRRMELVSQIADYKQAHHLPVQDPRREQEIFSAIEGQVEAELLPYATLFMEKVLEISRSYQSDRR